MTEKLGDDVQRLNMVVTAAWVKKIDDWRRKEPDLPSLSAAVRRLVDRFGFAAARAVFLPPFAAFTPPLAFRLAIASVLSEP